MNNKGFTFVEILAVIIIIGILTSIAVVGVTKYKTKAQRDDVTALVYGTISAFDEYLLDNPSETSVFTSKLKKEDYLSNDNDPYNKDGTCTIRIERINVDSNVGSNNKLDFNEYKVYVCCANRTKNYTYTQKVRGNDTAEMSVNVDGQCQAGYDTDKLYSSSYASGNPNVENVTSSDRITSPGSDLKKKTINIYTMEELSKDCVNSGGINNTYCTTSGCESPDGRVTEKLHNPYRSYDYYAYSCTCYYNKTGDKGYAGYNTDENPKDHHTMRVFYLNNTNGKNACKSEDTSMFNKYVHHVCMWGVFLNGATQINFHGYQWYRNNNGSYGSFTPNGFWYHDGEPFEWKATKEPGDTVDQGCAKTCLYMTPYWGGKTDS